MSIPLTFIIQPSVQNEFDELILKIDNFTKTNGQCSVDLDIATLRKEFGTNRSWLFGFNFRQTRHLYHKLLTNCISQQENICKQAKSSSFNRRVVKKYARERGNLLVYLVSHFIDGFRHRSVYGENDIQLWNKMALRSNNNNNDHNHNHNNDNINNNNNNDIDIECYIENENDHELYLWNEQKCSHVCRLLLDSAFKTNKIVDAWSGLQVDNNDNNNPSMNDKITIPEL